MKKLLLAIISLAFCLNVSAADREHTLKVYNWADYIDEKLIGEFEQWYKEQTGDEVKVIYETFDINENMLTEIELGHEDYDVCCPSEYIIERMLRNKLLLPINKDFGKTPNWLGNVSPFAIDKFQQMAPDSTVNVSDYAVGYMWGTTGIMFNKAKIRKEQVSSWNALLNPDFRLQIFMKDAFRDMYSAIICFAHYNDIKAGKVTRQELVGNVTKERIADVERVLMKAKPNVAGWEVDFGKEMMTKGKAWINVTWSGDATWAIEEAAENGVELDYIVPIEGSNCWFDGWVIPRYAKNTKAASYWINFLCKSENAVRNMEEIGYVSVIGTKEVLEAITDEDYEAQDLTYLFGEGAESVCANPVLYPDKSVIERCALMHDAADMTEEMLSMWNRVKGDSLNFPMLFFIGGVVTAIIIIIIIGKLHKMRMRQLRKQRIKLRRKNEIKKR